MIMAQQGQSSSMTLGSLGGAAAGNRLAPIPGIKKRKIDKRKKLENLRRQKNVTIIQAQWRGRLARNKVQPSFQSVDAFLDLSKDHVTPDTADGDETKQQEDDTIQKINPAEKDEKRLLLERQQSIHAAEKKHVENLLSLAEKNGLDHAGNTIKQGLIALIMLTIYFTFGTIFYGKTLQISYFRAFYFNIITVTTIGYGEISPDTNFTKIVTAINIFAGLAIFTIGLTFLLEFLAREKELLDEMLIARKFEEENKIEMDVKNGAEESIDNVEGEGRADESSASVPAKPKTAFEEVQWWYRSFIDSFPNAIREAIYSMLMAVVTVVVTVLVGVVFVMFVVESLSFVDAAYFCAVTISSVGYGDILPTSDRARVFVIFYGIIGTAMTANALSKFSYGISLLMSYDAAEEEDEEDALGDEVFALMDSDGDGKVVKAEFMLYKLVRMGLVKPEHLKNCSEQFHRLDFDGNGYLSEEDVQAFNEAMVKNKNKKKKKQDI